MAFGAAARDRAVARAIDEVATRRRSPLRLLDPWLTARILRHQPGEDRAS
jgi:hypothetical protein